MPLIGKKSKNIPLPAFIYRPTSKAGYVLKNHLGRPFSHEARRRFVRSDGFHVEYFTAENGSRRGRFDLRNVCFLCMSVDPDAGSYAIDVHIAVNGDAALTKMITVAFPDEAKEAVVDFYKRQRDGFIREEAAVVQPGESIVGLEAPSKECVEECLRRFEANAALLDSSFTDRFND